MKLKYLALIIFSLLIISSKAIDAQSRFFQKFDKQQQLTTIPDTVKGISSDFFNYLIKNQVDDAYSHLLFNSPLKEKKEQFDNLAEQTKYACTIYGLMRDYEFIKSEIPCSSLIRLTFISKHSDMPLRWLLTFYKTQEKGWIVINVKFDDSIELLFD